MELKRFKKSTPSRRVITIHAMMDELNKAQEILCESLQNQEDLDPLSISHVLNHTFRYCTVEELKSLRLVSKQWDAAATRILQEKCDPITFQDEFYDSEKMIKILKVLRNSVNPPYVNFEIASNFFTHENEDLITDFFHICGPFMEYLTICTHKNRESKFQFAEVLLTNVRLPKLKSLVFEDHTPYGGEETHHNHDFSTFFKALLSAASNLERLDMSFPKRFTESDPEDCNCPHLPQLPERIICSRSSQQLRHLEICAKITDTQMIYLAQSGLQLRTLHFRIRNVSLLESSFTTLLQSQSDTLEELKLTEERHGSNFLVKFPQMKKLSKITIISICEFENSSVTFAPFSYQDKLPKMETLILWNCFGKEARWAQFFHAESPSHSLTRLELPSQFRNPSLAENMSILFPVLKKLKIGFCLRPENEAVMRLLFETMDSLEELDIRTDMDNHNENIDHILTGIPKDVCKRMRHDGSFLANHGTDVVHRGPSLINLKNLRRLEIVMDNSRPPFITDLTGYMAFLQMPKLRTLRFTRYGMSEECTGVLMERFNVELIPPNEINFFEIEYLNLDFD